MSKGKRLYFSNGEKLQIIMYCVGIVLAISIISLICVFMFYDNNKADLGIMELGMSNDVVPNINENSLSQASTSDDKTVEESKNEVIKVQLENNKEEIVKEEIVSKEVVNEVKKDKKEETKEDLVENTTETNAEESAIEKSEEGNTSDKQKNLKFIAPISGEIIKDYAEETLVYSETLDEWTTHLGVDIEAKRTTAVKASADGIIESKKNDPRFGLTVTISHDNGFKTVYSNLLTAEYVTEGDEVKQGQTIGTVGETATFEILDPSHLHFEMIKDGKNVNPTIYMK